ncbi:hypothetical protein J2T15_005943 [Paenibacillus harenae]|uniref:Uncharacterized protein n=1 Tax=Paenibacillus harenae TaxID=306543 RepID=A0ABT9UA43_PAEHA|nr:hypothetical protein [Paenibacillus harenae]
MAVSLVVQFSKNNHLSFVSAVCLSGDFYNISQGPIVLQPLFFVFLKGYIYIIIAFDLCLSSAG